MGKVSKNSRTSRNQEKIVRKCKICGDETKAFKMIGFTKRPTMAHQCSCGVLDKAGKVLMTTAEFNVE